MSTLQCANIWFESTANNRVQYGGSNNYSFVGGGVTVMTVNSSAVAFPYAFAATTLNASNNVTAGPGGFAGAAAMHANGNIYATGDIVSAYSDIRLKNVSGPVNDALNKVSKIETFYYTPNMMALSIGADNEMKSRIGVSAQQMQEILPEVVCDSPVGQGYLTVQYERIVPLLIEAIKELKEEIRVLKETK